MSRSLRFASVALSVATTLVLVNAAQPKDQPAPTPLVDKSFSYPSGIVSIVSVELGEVLTRLSCSLTKLIPIKTLIEEDSSVITSATQPRKGRTRAAKPDL